MTPLSIIAVVNAVLWSGVILALLLGLMGGQRKIEARIARLDEALQVEPAATAVRKSKK